jgi:hypothetical protein
VAVTITEFGDGAIAGAVNVPSGASAEPKLLLAIKPHVAPEQPGPATLQVTVKFGLEPAAGANVAWNIPAAPEFTDAGPETSSVNPLAMLSVALPLAFASATLVAVIVALAGCGRIAGAV